MRQVRSKVLLVGAAIAAALAACAGGDKTSKALDSIRAEDMKFHQRFLSAPEFRGRNTPSTELDIASKYIAMTAERIGLKPLMPGGSYYQEIPVEVTTVAPRNSRMRLMTGRTERIFQFPDDATAGRGFEPGKAAGAVVFLGYGLSAPQLDWDDAGDIELKGKVAVILDTVLPDGHVLKPAENRRLLMSRTATLREKGAAAVVTIINEEREARLAEKGLTFDLPERLRFPDVVTSATAVPSKKAEAAPPTPAAPFLQVEVRHEAGAAILGVAPGDIVKMAEDIREGKRVPGKTMSGRTLEIEIAGVTRKEKTLNVVAYLEGTDPALSQEYVTISSHHDHNPVREGRVYPGSDDNISGVVGMFEIAEALMVARPKRSVIFVWNTAEEKGLIGSYHFVQHCPVPVEKISANLNLDMISRNDTGHLYLIGSNKLSSELDASIQAMNNKPGPGLKLDYKYEDPAHPDRFFFRSDQYPYIRYGIPGVWFFCGTTEDYHMEGDAEAKADYTKMENVSKLVYLVAMDVGNKAGLLRLDLRPDVKTRGEQNMRVGWR
jgi:hypothetical protein